jgi:hypothetical protein
MESRAVVDSRTPEEGKQSQAVIEDARLPLEQKKRKIQRNLRTLEQTGHVSSKNKYQDILNEIAKVSGNSFLFHLDLCWHMRGILGDDMGTHGNIQGSCFP